ncbi:MAG: hypothetical protein R3A43_03890 [Bacteroidia bacterium]
MVENAIEHGLIRQNISHPMLQISLSEINQTLVIKVIDNGVGIDTSLISKSDSIALGNIKKRIDAINRLEEISVELDITNNEIQVDSEFKTGTTCVLKITYK